MSPEIEYDVRHVPFPLERDPELDGLKPTGRKPRKRKPLSDDAFERYRLYTEDELGEFAPVSWLIDRFLALGELSGFYGKGGTFKSFVALDWGVPSGATRHPGHLHRV